MNIQKKVIKLDPQFEELEPLEKWCEKTEL